MHETWHGVKLLESGETSYRQKTLNEHIDEQKKLTAH